MKEKELKLEDVDVPEVHKRWRIKMKCRSVYLWTAVWTSVEKEIILHVECIIAGPV